MAASPLTLNDILIGGGGLNVVPATAIPSGITATTQTAGDNSTKIATTAYADASAKAAVAPGAIYSVPALGTFTQNNFAFGGGTGTTTATQTVSGGAILINEIRYNASTASLVSLSLAQPATPYKLRVQVAYLFGVQNSQSIDVGFFDGTKYLTFEVVSTSASVFRLAEWAAYNNVGTVTNLTGTLGGALWTMYSPLWVQIRNDGTTLNFDLSLDGQNYFNVTSQSVGTYLTPTQIMVGGFNASSASQPSFALNVLNWATFADANLNGP